MTTVNRVDDFLNETTFNDYANSQLANDKQNTAPLSNRVDDFLSGISSSSQESSYGDILSKAATNAKLGLLQAAGGAAQGIGEAPLSAIQTLTKPSPSLPDNPSIQDYISKYATYPANQLLAKGELAASALPEALAPGIMDTLAEKGKQIQQEATAQQGENQPNVVPGTLKSKISSGAQMGAQMLPILAAAPVAPEVIPALFGIQGAGSTYAEQTNAGKTGGEALLPSVASGVANTAIGDIPMGILTAEGGSLPAKLLKAGIAGEITSQGLNVVQQGINKGTIDPNMTWDQFTQTAKDLGGIGAVLGMAGGAVAHPFSTKSHTIEPPITNLQGENLPTQEYNPATGKMQDSGGEPSTEPPSSDANKYIEPTIEQKTIAKEPEISPSELALSSELKLSPSTDIDTVDIALNAIKSGDTQNIHPDIVDDLSKTGEIKIDNTGQPVITDLGNRLIEAINQHKIETTPYEIPTAPEVKTTDISAQPHAEELPHAANTNIENPTRVGENAITPIAEEVQNNTPPIKRSDLDNLQQRLIDLEHEHDSLPVDSPLRDPIKQEMNDIVERIPQVKQARDEGLLKTAKNIPESIGGSAEIATPEEEKAVANYHDEKGIIPYSVTPTERFAANKDNIKTQLDNIIKRINPSVKTEFSDKLFGEGEAIKASGGNSTARQEVGGSYNKAENLIKASLNADKWDVKDTAYHEAYHSIRDMVTPSDDIILKKAFPGTDKLAQPEHEAVEFGRFMTDKNASGFSPAIRRIFSTIRQALRDIGRTLKLGKFNSVEDIFNRVERGSVYDAYQKAIKEGDIEVLKQSDLSPEQREQAIKEASPALHDVVYKAMNPEDEAALRDVNMRANGTPIEKATAIGNDVYQRTAKAIDKGLDTVESAKEKMLRSTIDLVKPIISEKTYNNAKDNIEHSIAMTKRNKAGLDIGRTLKDVYGVTVASQDGFGRSIASKFNSQTTTDVMDMFHPEPGKARSIKATYHEEIQDYYNKTMSHVANVLKNIKSTADKEAVRDFMVHPERMVGDAVKSGNGRVAAHLARTIQNMREHLAAAGYEVPEVDGFYPRIYDTDYIVRNEGKFKKDAKIAYLDTYKDDFKDMYEKLNNSYNADLNRHRNYEQEISRNPSYEFQRDNGVSTNGDLQKARQDRLDNIRSKYMDENGKILPFDQFKDLFIQDRVNSWYNNILLQDNGITNDPNKYFRSVSTTPDAPSSFKQRTLSKNADDILADYMVRDPLSAMNKLTMQTARKAAWESRFGGDKLQKIHDGLIKDGLDSLAVQHVMDIIRGNTGQLGGNINPSVKNALGLARYWTSVNFLIKAPFKHLSIALNAGTQTGDLTNAWRTFHDSLHALLNTDKGRAMKTLGELSGIYGEAAEHSLLMNQTGMETSNEKLNWLNKQFFKGTGMSQLVGSFRVGMMRSIQYYMANMAEDITKFKNSYKSSEFMIKNYGVPAEEVGNFAKWVMDAGGKNISQSIMLDNSPYSKMYQLAMQRAVNQIISNPTPATRQMYANHPVGGVIMQMSAYHMGFLKNTMERNARLFKEGITPGNGFTPKDRMRMLSPMAMTIPVMWSFMAAYNAAKDSLFPPDKEDKNSGAVASFMDADFLGAFNGLAKDIAESQKLQKNLGYEYNKFNARKSTGQKAFEMLGPDAVLATKYWDMIGNLPNHLSDSEHKKDYQLKSEYNLLVAPITTAALSNYNAFPVLTFAAIQAINHPSVRRLLTNAKQP